MGWVKRDLKPILVANGARFFAAKGDDRKAVVDDFVLLLKATNQELPKKVSTRIKTWYNNEIAQFREVREKDKSSGKIKVKRYDAKLVAQEDYSECYDEIKEEMNQAGEPWNEIHRLTISKLWGELSEDEQEECQQKAMSINIGEISESDKCRLASASADKDIAAFVKRIQEIYRVRMVCLSSWTDIKGKTQTLVHETSLSPKFSQQFPKWKVQKGVVNSFLEYSESFEDVGSNNSSDEEGEKKLQKAKYPWARTGMDIHPLLPEVPKMLGTEWIGGAKIMIRAFVKEVLKLATGSSSPPWTAMATPEGTRSLIAEKYLPVGVGLKDPSWMKKSKKPLAFKVEEVRQKVAQDGRLRVAALKPTKRAYVEVDDEDPLSEEDGSSKKKRKPGKDHTKKVVKYQIPSGPIGRSDSGTDGGSGLGFSLCAVPFSTPGVQFRRRAEVREDAD
ncbi:hypothetical protein B0H10DRAFT_2186511 [Mycena sp. CBHHK59/15]|nr:hypothetical protein B0H10DRAFT_2186511 [Mycena sp. CBHHK59/15]